MSEVQTPNTGAPLTEAPAVPVPQGARYESVNSEAQRQARAATAPPVEAAGDETPDEEDDAPAADPPSVMGAGGQKIEGDALKVRLERERERERKRLLREHYGTDDPQAVSKIKADREAQTKEYERLRRVEEARKRSRLTAEQRMQKEFETKEQEIQRLREELKSERQGGMIKEQNAVISNAVGKHIADSSRDFVMFKLKQHVKELQEDPKKLRAFSSKLDKNLDKWLEDFAKANPQHAIASPLKEEVVKEPTPPVEPRRRPITTGNPPPKRTPAANTPGQVGGKTVKPGPQQMSKSELKEVYAQKGMKLPY